MHVNSLQYSKVSVKQMYMSFLHTSVQYPNFEYFKVWQNSLSLTLSCLYQRRHVDTHVALNAPLLPHIQTFTLHMNRAATSLTYAPESRVATMAGISNPQHIYISIASWIIAELSVAQFDYMTWEKTWWSHRGGQTLVSLYKDQSPNPSTNNDKLRL